MTTISRRNVLVGAVVAPCAFPASLPVAMSAGLPSRDNHLIAKAALWISSDDGLTALEVQWQDLECQLFSKAKHMKISCEKAGRSTMPEAQAMRVLDREIAESYRFLAITAYEASQMPATTIAGAIAKIELGLRVQGPFDWKDHAHELLEDGIAELRTLVSQA